MQPAEIRTDRLLLRPWQPGDAPAVLAACSDPLIARWTTVPSPYTAEHARGFVEQLQPAGWANDAEYGFAVTEAASGSLLGAIGLRPRAARGTADVGFWCAARGSGVTTEALVALCRWGHEQVGIDRIEWFAAVGNWGSRRVAEKAGFTVEGVLRNGLPDRHVRRDCWVGARLAADPVVDTRLLPAYPDLTDGVVTLRRWRSEDADDVRRACSDPLTVRFLPVPSPYTLEDGRRYVDDVVPAGWADGTAANVAVTAASGGELLGAVGVKLELREHGVGEVGYWTAPQARGRGVAGRAAGLHAQWALDALVLDRVELLADVDNTASQRVAEKAGFVREGVLRRARPDRTGEARDMVVFARVR